VSELHLGRLPEAEAALQQALAIDADDADTLANLVVLNTLLGKDGQAREMKERLGKVDGEHRAVKEWREKRGEFEAASKKYSPRFEVGT
jgi:coatomer protein complex subunit epsilon